MTHTQLQQLTDLDMLAIAPDFTEAQLLRMRKLKAKIKVLEAEYEMLKKTVVLNYFANNEEFRTEKGLLLASYKSTIRTSFDQKSFKKEEPLLYLQYEVKTNVSTFLLK